MKEFNGQVCYLELLKKSLLNEIYLADEERMYYLRQCLAGDDEFSYQTLHDISTERPDTHQEFLRSRQIGQFPYRKISNSGFQHSMIGRARLDSLHDCLDAISHDGLDGDLVECGVWRGGAAIFMRGFLHAHNITGKKVFMADSFAGLPKSNEPDDPDLSADRFPELAVSLQDVLENFALYDLLDDQVVPLEGWFCDTLPNAPIEKLALLRADGDLFTSTMDILENLYDKVVDGGFVIIDDYGVLPPCKRAVESFFAARGAPLPEFHPIDWSAVYWRKPAN